MPIIRWVECHYLATLILIFSQPPPQSTKVPSTITFSWKRCKDRPEGMSVGGQPVALNGKLYVRSERSWPLCDVPVTVLEYTPGHDHWAKLPPPPVDDFIVATLRGQLLVVGGTDKSSVKKTNTILTFNEHSRQWVQSYPAMPTALTKPAVIGYQDHLIVAGGWNDDLNQIIDVNILDTTTNKWNKNDPLPSTDTYHTLLHKDTMYLVGQDTRTVLRAHVPTLISGANKSGVWETLPNTLYYDSTPVTIGNTLLVVGGMDSNSFSSFSIQMYDPTTNQWMGVGNLPKCMRRMELGPPCCVIINSELFVLGVISASYHEPTHASLDEVFTIPEGSLYVYTSILTMVYYM